MLGLSLWSAVLLGPALFLLWAVGVELGLRRASRRRSIRRPDGPSAAS
jgi:hypothetical protein